MENAAGAHRVASNLYWSRGSTSNILLCWLETNTELRLHLFQSKFNYREDENTIAAYSHWLYPPCVQDKHIRSESPTRWRPPDLPAKPVKSPTSRYLVFAQ